MYIKESGETNERKLFTVIIHFLPYCHICLCVCVQSSMECNHKSLLLSEIAYQKSTTAFYYILISKSAWICWFAAIIIAWTREWMKERWTNSAILKIIQDVEHIMTCLWDFFCCRSDRLSLIIVFPPDMMFNEACMDRRVKEIYSNWCCSKWQ